MMRQNDLEEALVETARAALVKANAIIADEMSGPGLLESAAALMKAATGVIRGEATSPTA
jgi:hypothetical protein